MVNGKGPKVFVGTSSLNETRQVFTSQQLILLTTYFDHSQGCNTEKGKGKRKKRRTMNIPEVTFARRIICLNFPEGGKEGRIGRSKA